MGLCTTRMRIQRLLKCTGEQLASTWPCGQGGGFLLVHSLSCALIRAHALQKQKFVQLGKPHGVPHHMQFENNLHGHVKSHPDLESACAVSCERRVLKLVHNGNYLLQNGTQALCI